MVVDEEGKLEAMGAYINFNSQQYFAFNIWSIESAKAVLDAAEKVYCDVILQTSMKAFETLEKDAIRSFVTRYAVKKNIHAYLHLDHCRKLECIREAIDSGWDSVMIDASDKPLAENISITQQVCTSAKNKGVLVEAEIGQIIGCEDGIAGVEAGVAKIEDVKEFLQHVDVDMLAVAIGTAHGLYHGIPNLHYNLIEQVSFYKNIPLVIHGGTGLTDEMYINLLNYPVVKKINISTDVKMAYRKGIEIGLKKGYMKEKNFDPLKMAELIHDSIENMVLGKLKLLKKIGE